MKPIHLAALAAVAAAALASPAAAAAAAAEGGSPDAAPRLSLVGGVNVTLNPFNDWFAGETARLGGRLLLSAPAEVTYRLVGREATEESVFGVGDNVLFLGRQLRGFDADGAAQQTVSTRGRSPDFWFASRPTLPRLGAFGFGRGIGYGQGFGYGFGFGPGPGDRSGHGYGLGFGLGFGPHSDFGRLWRLPFLLPEVAVQLVDETRARLLFEDFRRFDLDYDDLVVELTVRPIPEPSEIAFMTAGLALAALLARRRGRGRPDESPPELLSDPVAASGSGRG